MNPLQQQHLQVITSEVIPMTDEQRAADHADISVRFAIDQLNHLFMNFDNYNSTVLFSEIERLEKMLKSK
jgi:hypothetical protein